jgi:hypothetical protein
MIDNELALPRKDIAQTQCTIGPLKLIILNWHHRETTAQRIHAVALARQGFLGHE